MRLTPLPDMPTSTLAGRNLVLEHAVHGLFIEPGPAAPAAGGGAPAAPAAAAAAPAAPAPGDKGGAPAAAAAAAAAPAPGAAPAAGEKPGTSVIEAPKEPAAAAAPSVADQRKALIERTADGKTPEGKKALEGKTDAEITALYGVLEKAEKEAAGQLDVAKLVAPKGVELSPDTLKAMGEIFANDKLTPQARAQALVDLHAKTLTSIAEAQRDSWFKTQETWQNEVKNDKDLGGAKYDATRAVISSGIVEIMGGLKEAQPVFEAFRVTGAGNNPAIVRLMAKVGTLLKEPEPAGGTAPGAAKNRSFAQRVAAMYPSATGSQSAGGAG